MGIEDDLTLEFRESVPSLRKGECRQLARLALAVLRRECDPVRVEVTEGDSHDVITR